MSSSPGSESRSSIARRVPQRSRLLIFVAIITHFDESIANLECENVRRRLFQIDLRRGIEGPTASLDARHPQSLDRVAPKFPERTA